MINKSIRHKEVGYEVRDGGVFRIHEYTNAKPFSNFLPAVAGNFGIPLWAFFVNRGQGIASFGVSDKDHAIMQFYPANRSYELTSIKGFRTFIKYTTGSKQIFYEPFQNQLSAQGFRASRYMDVYASGFSISEVNHSLGITTTVEYFGVPNEVFAALARKVTIKNHGRTNAKLEVVDGIPSVVPFGLKEFYLKDMSRTVEAWMVSDIVRKKESATALFKLKSDPEDRPEFQSVDGAHFYLPFGVLNNSSLRTIKPSIIVDPESLFGSNTEYLYPENFIHDTLTKKINQQVMENRTPCAFSAYKASLNRGQTMSLYSFLGETKEGNSFLRRISKLATVKYFDVKNQENIDFVERLQTPASTFSGSDNYDQYCKQTYLDNLLRGGSPEPATKGNDPMIFHVFSRKHGDLERDYNRFVIQPTFFSQGEGNYRDVNQNRRNDVWFEPRVKDLNIKMFFNLIQSDGYNPLIVEQLKLVCKDLKTLRKSLSKQINPKGAEKIAHYMKEPRTPGEIFQYLAKTSISTSLYEKVFEILFSLTSRWETARHGEGFWSEHWTYNLDLLESYLEVYPEKLRDVLLLDKTYTYYDNDHRVRPRSEKYFQLDNGSIRQYQAVYKDEDKARLIGSRTYLQDKVRTNNGKGKIYSSNLLAKIICVIANKYASLDPQGAGLEMEADKPDWYDALNGLPGLFGSTFSGTYELYRLIRFVQAALELIESSHSQSQIKIPEELFELIKSNDLVTRNFLSKKSKMTSLEFWDKSHSNKEKYWEKTRFGFSGKEINLSFADLLKFLSNMDKKVEGGIRTAYSPKKEICPTYFWYEVVSFKTKKRQGKKAQITPTKFKQHKLAPFLEGPVHALKVEPSEGVRSNVYKKVRASSLYDKKLGMYTVTSSLLNESPEIGRCRVFAPGWLENQSVFLHMEYKWLLELLKSGMHKQFFEDFKSSLVAFQDPSRYGRSIYENSSFIASSAFVDEKLHGNGFVARLSGSTAEFMDMWLKMNLGLSPFRLNQNKQLELHLNPILPKSFFTKSKRKIEAVLRSGKKIVYDMPKSSFAFLLFGETLIVYKNSRQLDTFGPKKVSAKRITFKDNRNKKVVLDGGVLPEPYAKDIRMGLIKLIEVELG